MSVERARRALGKTARRILADELSETDHLPVGINAMERIASRFPARVTTTEILMRRMLERE